MKLSEKQQDFSSDVARFILYGECLGIRMTFGDAYRPWMLQLLYYFGYEVKTIEGKLKLVKAKKVSWTMNSLHLSRLAVDFNFFIDGLLTYDKEKLQKLGDYWEGLRVGNKWGGNFPKDKIDCPHIQGSK